MQNLVFIVDSSSEERQRLAMTLAGDDIDVRQFGSAEDFLLHLGATTSGCVIAPSDLAGMGVRALIAALRGRDPPLFLVVLGREDSLSYAVDLMRAGAFEYLDPPIFPRRLRSAVLRAIASRSLT